MARTLFDPGKYRFKKNITEDFYYFFKCNPKRYIQRGKQWRFVLKAPSDTKLRDLHPKARQRGSPPHLFI